jgi:tetratricopeptide (TPR) repeat protein
MQILICFAFGFLLVLTTRLWAEESWVGEKVMQKGPDRATFRNRLMGSQVYIELKGAVFPVLKEHDGWIRLRGGDGTEGWAAKDDFVPVQSAPAYFTEQIVKNVKDSWPWLSRGIAWYMQGEYEKAIKDFGWAIRLDPEYVDAYYNRGNAWCSKKEYGKAIQDFDEVIRLDPQYMRAFNSRGHAWSSQKEYAKAIEDYSEAIRLDPKYVPALTNRGSAWVHTKEYDRAIHDYDEAIHLDPKNALAFGARAVAWRRKKEYGKAMKDCDEAICLDPKNACAFYVRGLIWYKNKAYNNAIRDYDEAIRIDPKFANALTEKAYLLAVSPDDSRRDGKKSLQLAKQAQALDKDNGWRMRSFSVAHAELGEFDLAIKWQKMALEDEEYANDADEKAKAEK